MAAKAKKYRDIELLRERIKQGLCDEVIDKMFASGLHDLCTHIHKCTVYPTRIYDCYDLVDQKFHFYCRGVDIPDLRMDVLFKILHEELFPILQKRAEVLMQKPSKKAVAERDDMVLMAYVATKNNWEFIRQMLPRFLAKAKQEELGLFE